MKQRRTLMQRDRITVYVEYEGESQTMNDALDRLQAAISDLEEINPRFRAILAQIDRGAKP